MITVAAASPILFTAGGVCFAAFSWGVKSHFRRTEGIPAGTYAISALTLVGFSWFTWRLADAAPGIAWRAALVMFAAAITIFAWAIGSTRKSPPTLAFDTDAPFFLLQHGPYRHVRHPFYLSYLLFWSGTATASPGLLPWAPAAIMMLVYWQAAMREERKFARSEFSSAYQRYREKTGMFLPRAQQAQAAFGQKIWPI